MMISNEAPILIAPPFNSNSDCDIVFYSAGAYAAPVGYSTTKLAPPKFILPPVAFVCSARSIQQMPKATTRWIKHSDLIVNKQANQTFNTCKAFVVENAVHHQHQRRVVTTVNRRHLHVQRIITRENHFHHFNTDYVVKVNDIQRQQVTSIVEPGVTRSDYKQTARVEIECINDASK